MATMLALGQATGLCTSPLGSLSGLCALPDSCFTESCRQKLTSAPSQPTLFCRMHLVLECTLVRTEHWGSIGATYPTSLKNIPADIPSPSCFSVAFCYAAPLCECQVAGNLLGCVGLSPHRCSPAQSPGGRVDECGRSSVIQKTIVLSHMHLYTALAELCSDHFLEPVRHAHRSMHSFTEPQTSREGRTTMLADCAAGDLMGSITSLTSLGSQAPQCFL